MFTARPPVITLTESLPPAATLGVNLSLRVLAYNLVANAALYLSCQLTPFPQQLQTLNHSVLWRLFWL